MDDLLASGARIQDVNAVRKHLLTIKGGQFAAAATPVMVVNLVLSDVIGNDVEGIDSSPLASRFIDLRERAQRRRVVDPGYAGSCDNPPPT